MTRRPHRFTVELSEDTMDTIRELADLDGITMSEVVRRAVRANKFLVQTRIAGERVLIQDKKNGHVRELVIW